MSQQSVGRHAEALRDRGVVVVEDYISAERCDEIHEATEAALERGELAEARPEDGYEDHVARREPLVKRRTGERDDGMLDLFNMELRVPELGEFKDDAFVANIVNRATDGPYSADNVNVYVNRSVTNTRDFHADTYSGKFKSFVYLTDVPDESYGPFAYIEGSHESSVIERTATKVTNRLRDDPATNALFYDESDVRVCTAPRGTLIVSNQAGYHRGLPQREGRERILATTSYTPE